tara:strand:- start:230 stop:430 length:201 start_codon:yes stop_codon:yes gene_type:complete
MKRVEQVKKENRAYQGYEIDGTIVEIIISNDEVASLLQNFDPDDFNSPDIVTCRALARLILDALNS